MFFHRKSANVRKSPAALTGRRPAPFRPALEALEARDVPSATTYADTLHAWGTGAGVAGRNTYYYDTRGALAGKLPGSFSSHLVYNGVLTHGTNAVTGGTLGINVPGARSVAGALQGRVAGGSLQWSTSGRGATATITFTIKGGSGAYAGDTGTATFHGTMDRGTQVLTGTLTLTLNHPAAAASHTSTSRSSTSRSSSSSASSSHSSSSGGSSSPSRSSASTTYTDTLRATGTGAGSAGRNTFFYDTRGTLSGKLPGTFSTRVYYTGSLGSATNPITSGSWSANITGSSSTAGSLQGRIAGGSIRWTSTGRSASVNVTFTVTGGSGAYTRDTGTGSFQGTMDWTTQALTGTLTLNLTHPR